MLKHEIINALIKKYNFTKYLEIGVFNGDNIEKVEAKLKHGVDPGLEGVISRYVTHPVTSNVFFESIDAKFKYDIILIDGLHYADQVVKDIENSIKHLAENGYIILHDCLPVSYESQVVPRKTMVWNGDVWRAFTSFRKANSCFESYCIDTDYGVGVIKNNTNCILQNFKAVDITYQEFQSNKNTLLGIISVDEFISLKI